jgi:asparagine synthase (glutamine-hydrolysing)
MSVQFGTWNFDGKPIARNDLEKAYPFLTPYAPDGRGTYEHRDIWIHYRAFHTTCESQHEIQPHIATSATVITWDGCLDNRADLLRELRPLVTASATDVSIVAAAYERWGTDCLSKLIGDWAMCIWNKNQRSLILAKDPIGTHPLYYLCSAGHVAWSTILEPLVLLADRSFDLDEEYLAGWLGSFPQTHLTPYSGIYAVSPSSFVSFNSRERTVRKYWDFDPLKKIHYQKDSNYEEHFRSVFAEAVRRKLRSDNPVLAELSGGMDSSAIVCVADTVLDRGAADAPRLDTVSYYNDSEPNWNERPYFTRVEEKRKRSGCHIDVGSQDFFNLHREADRFAATPGIVGYSANFCRRFTELRKSQHNRVVLSGLGGDEVTGGVPTPAPELEDLLARGHFKTLAQRLKVWALNKREPWFHLFLEAAGGFFPPRLVAVPKYRRPLPWLQRGFVSRNRAALTGYRGRLKLFDALPSFQDNLFTLDTLRRQLACNVLSPEPYEKRYPYLDRDLLEFLFAIPREQLVRPGQRRSLMRRALAEIVPAEILNRKRKAFVSRAPMLAISQEWASLTNETDQMMGTSLGIILTDEFSNAIEKTRRGIEVPIVGLVRTLALEAWLRTLNNFGFLSGRLPMHSNKPSAIGAKRLPSAKELSSSTSYS